MMKKVLDIIVLTTFWSIIFAPLYLVSVKLGMGVVAFIAAFYLLFLFVSILYKHVWSFETFRNKKNIIKFSSVVLISFLFLLYLTNLFCRSYDIYKGLMAEDKGNSEGIEYQADDVLGFKPVPNARSFQVYSPDDKIPIAYDHNGFRVPLSDSLKIKKMDKTGLLFLGCSFTFGAGCYAEETFPFLVAKATHLSYINAGGSSYGLAQMLILAEKLIPEYKPDYVIVQYSPWLAPRSTNVFSPTNSFQLPVPYFAKRENRCVLNPPIYISHLKSIDTKTVKSQYRGQFIRFLYREAFVFSLYEIWHYVETKFLLITDKSLRPATDLREVERYAYNRIKDAAKKNGSTLIILNLGDMGYTSNSHNLFADSDVHFAEADFYLDEFVKRSFSKNYYVEFGHWVFNGNENVLVDCHPNAKAHRIIADVITTEIARIGRDKTHHPSMN